MESVVKWQTRAYDARLAIEMEAVSASRDDVGNFPPVSGI